MMILGVFMPWRLNLLTVASSPITSQTSPNAPAQVCIVVSSTVTSGNVTRRAVSITVADNITISDQIIRVYAAGPQNISSALSSILTALSIVSSVGIAVIATALQSKNFRNLGKLVLFPSIGALWLLSLAIAVAIYDSLLGPLSGSRPDIFLVYLSFATTLWGFGFSLMALAGALRKELF
jgi:hypothetical protein